MTASLKRYSGLYAANSGVRRLTFEAADDAEAKELAVRWGVAIQGDAITLAPKLVYTPAEVMAVLNVSRATVKRLLWAEKLERVRGSWKILITADSLERYCALRN